MLGVQRMTADELFDELRLAGVRRLVDVELAVLETDGKMSFLRRDDEPGRTDHGHAAI
jgi:uncharacterized membrane protein YcaP (DUF421 family)